MRVIAGSAKGMRLNTPDGMLTRPTTDRVKEALFSIIHFDLPGARVLDLFAGTGQLGIEAVSRGASFAVFVDEREAACRLVRENVKKTGFENKATVLRSDYANYLRHCRDKFDIIFLDPPYSEVFLENSLKIITEIDILQSGGIIATEYPLGKVLPEAYSAYFDSKEYRYGKTVLTLFRKID
ncbi:MAG: 16S rRNA (guanine(966)-N(2))-methyltransferase RsmD [Oscillospiraceae bacterium]|nr:16S rRNA (guanine(966)-N(2))-methyltransferase RsmD [Oscillospiraceae bacterium]